jgi:hypothetical protein
LVAHYLTGFELNDSTTHRVDDRVVVRRHDDGRARSVDPV